MDYRFYSIEHSKLTNGPRRARLQLLVASEEQQRVDSPLLMLS